MNTEEVHHRLQEVIRDNVPLQGELARVKSVDKELMECVVIPVANEELDIEEVNLKAVIDGTPNGFIRIPAVDSLVLISPIENTDGDHYVVMYSDIDELLFIQNDKEILNIDNEGNIVFLNNTEAGSVLSIQSDGNVIFHEGEISGLIDAVELKTQLEKNTQTIQAILDVFSNWTPAPQDGGAALKGQSASLATTQLGDFSNIENDKVTH